MGNGVGLRNFEKRYSLMTSNAVEIIEIPDSCTIKINLLIKREFDVRMLIPKLENKGILIIFK